MQSTTDTTGCPLTNFDKLFYNHIIVTEMPDPVTDTDGDRVRTEPDMPLFAGLHNEV